MKWLNSKGTDETDVGYLKKLTNKSQKMITEMKYYLGSVTAYWGGGEDTTILAYEHERSISGCAGNKGSIENNSKNAVEANETCRVFTNNDASWTGKIGLMYASDYGFTMDSSYWDNKRLYDDVNTYKDSSWLYSDANHTSNEWLLSPSSGYYIHMAYWSVYGYVHSGNGFNLNPNVTTYCGVRPTLYLNSEVQIIGGNGSLEQPYQLK